ncbi:hypothetical protein ABZX75_17270 [Streptomyces sp. NPDC003038]|uniref:hypothetical protein n=1 Tax=unclassified Streptomyces TaxID=2593676 RepID=UPI0033B139DE
MAMSWIRMGFPSPENRISPLADAIARIAYNIVRNPPLRPFGMARVHFHARALPNSCGAQPGLCPLSSCS